MISLAQNSDESEPVTDDSKVAQEYAELLTGVPAGLLAILRGIGGDNAAAEWVGWWEGCEELP